MVCTTLVLLTTLAALPSPTLLPRPQKVTASQGAFPLAGVAVRIAGRATAEDRFAANELATFLSGKTGKKVAVGGGSRAIVLRRTGTASEIPMPDEPAGRQSREAYALEVTPRSVEISSPSSAGIYYGVQTLKQLVAGAGATASLPAVEVEDWPSLAYRGYMMDMSHMGLPTEAEVKKQIDLLTRYKANQYYFYSEASIELERTPMMSGGGRFTQDSVRRIIAYARERHMDVVPMVELFGHMHDLFRLEHHADLALEPHAGEFDPLNPRVAAVVTAFAEEHADLFPSPFVQIGFDEPWALDVSAKRPGAGSPEQLYTKMLKTVYDALARKKKRVGAYGDIMMKHPAIVKDLPKDLIIYPWFYNVRDDYKPYFEPFAKAGLKTILTTGVMSWFWIVPDIQRTLENTDRFLAEGRRHGNIGILNTGWTDDTLVLMRSAFPGMVYGAVAGWHDTPIPRAQFLSDYTAIEYPPAAADHVKRGLEAIDDGHTKLSAVVKETTIYATFGDPFAPGRLSAVRQNRAQVSEARKLAEVAQDHFRKALKLGANPDGVESWLLGAEAVDYCALRHLYALEITDLWQRVMANPTLDAVKLWINRELATRYHTRLVDLIEQSMDLQKKYEQAWLREYTPYRMPGSMIRWTEEAMRWSQLRRRLYKWSGSFKEGTTKIPPLATMTGDLF